MIAMRDARNYVLALPEVTEVEHWGKPSFRVNNKIIAVIQEDGVTLTVKTTGDDRAIYTAMDPDAYRVPESFSNLNYMHANTQRADAREIEDLLYKAWRGVAPKKLVKSYIRTEER